MQQYKPAMSISIRHRLPPYLFIVFLLGTQGVGGAHAQPLTISPDQRAKAEQVAQAGVALNELAADAPDHYAVKSGDTLWAISSLFLRSPWRWPELWGMNLNDITNPHRIYPGQQLYLLRSNGRAVLTTQPAADSAGTPTTQTTVKLSPRSRPQALSTGALPTLEPHLIEPFLAEPIIVSATELQSAPRIVATQEGRVLLSRGDRAYARGPASAALTDPGVGPQPRLRVFRNPVPLKDPATGAVLGYEAQYLGKALLIRSEMGALGATQAVPATIDIVEAKEEMRVGDRLLPEPVRDIRQYIPSAPKNPVTGRIVSVYGSGVANAAQNQVVVISQGTADGLRSGDVLALLKDGATLVDRTDAVKSGIKLPNERNGLLMVFRPFEKLSYALILETTDGVKIGDRVTNPR